MLSCYNPGHFKWSLSFVLSYKLFLPIFIIFREARGCVVARGTILQTERSPVSSPGWGGFFFFNLHNASGRTMALGSTQPLKQWVPGIFLVKKSGRRLGLTNLPPSVNRMPENVVASTPHNHKDLHGLYRGSFINYLPYVFRFHLPNPVRFDHTNSTIWQEVQIMKHIIM
jgi:hypothetical protein